MSLEPGQDLAHYRIDRIDRIDCKIGEGGMGEVWAATDTRLNRPAAIKELPAALADSFPFRSVSSLRSHFQS